MHAVRSPLARSMCRVAAASVAQESGVMERRPIPGDIFADPREALPTSLAIPSGGRVAARELLETVIYVLLVFFVVRGVIQNFKIEGQSMEPSFHGGQFILVNKLVYFHFDLNAPLRLIPGNSELPRRMIYPFTLPQRGDVVVFEYPNDLSKDYIKRVIALPGERVEIIDGRVLVNGVELDEPYLHDTITTCRFSDPCSAGPVVVKPGTVFVMGDNRTNSSDSREWDSLPLDRVIGRAWISYWPQEYWGAVPQVRYAAP
jgi:signal peptidase I